MVDQTITSHEVLDELCSQLKDKHSILRDLLNQKDITAIRELLCELCKLLEDICAIENDNKSEVKSNTMISSENQFILLSTITLLDCWGIMPIWNSKLKYTIDECQYIMNLNLTKDEVSSGIDLLCDSQLTFSQIHMISVLQKFSEFSCFDKLMSSYAYTNMIGFILSVLFDPSFQNSIDKDIISECRLIYDKILDHCNLFVLISYFRLLKKKVLIVSIQKELETLRIHFLYNSNSIQVMNEMLIKDINQPTTEEMITIAKGLGCIKNCNDIQYFKSISEQIYQYINQTKGNLGTEMIYILNFIYSTNPTVYKEYFLKSYFSSFNCLLSDFIENTILNEKLKDKNESIDIGFKTRFEHQISLKSFVQQIDILVYILSCFVPPIALINSLSIYMPILFYSYVACTKFGSYYQQSLAPKLRNILLTYFKLSSTPVMTLMWILNKKSLNTTYINTFIPITDIFCDYINMDVIEEYKQKGILTVAFYPFPWAPQSTICRETNQNYEIDILIDILKPLKNTHILGDFFLELLKIYFHLRIYTQDMIDVDIDLNICVLLLLKMIEIFGEQLFENHIYQGVLCISNICSSIMDNIENNNIKTDDIILFINDSDEDKMSKEGALDILKMALQILQCIYFMIDEVEWKEETQERIHPVSEDTKRIQMHVKEEAKQMEKESQYEVMDRHKMLSILKTFKQSIINHNTIIKQKDNDFYLLFQDLLDYIEKSIQSIETIQSNTNTNKTNNNTTQDTDSLYIKQLPSILKNLNHPMPPYRAYALSLLLSLIREQKQNLKPYFEEISTICYKGLSDPESYVFLYAVKIMVYLSDYFFDDTVPLLLDRFQSPDVEPLTKLKIGEAIVNIIRYHKQGIYKFKDLLMNAYMYNISISGPYSYKIEDHNSIGDDGNKYYTDNELLRASCFESILSICEFLNYQIDNYMAELYSHCMGVLKNEYTTYKSNILLSNAIYELLYHIIIRNDEMSSEKQLKLDFKLIDAVLTKYTNYCNGTNNPYVIKIFSIVENTSL